MRMLRRRPEPPTPSRANPYLDYRYVLRLSDEITEWRPGAVKLLIGDDEPARYFGTFEYEAKPLSGLAEADAS